MEAGLLEIVRSLNRSWIDDDTYFSLYRAIHPGKSSGGKCPGGDVRIPVNTVRVMTIINNIVTSPFSSQFSAYPYIPSSNHCTDFETTSTTHAYPDNSTAKNQFSEWTLPK